MNKALLILAMLIGLNTFSQSNYSRGFETGYQKGFCYNQGIGCVPPTPPIAPVPRASESSQNYNDGYNRGFEMGLNAVKQVGNTTSQRKRISTSNKSTSKFQSLTQDEMLSVPLALQKRYNENQRYLHEMKKWIIEIKGQMAEETFKQRLDKVNQTLIWLEDKDLARSTRELNQCELRIIEIITSYNELVTSTIYSTHIKTRAPLRAKPDSYSENLQWCSVGTKVLVLDTSDSFYKVSVNGTIGYILKFLLVDY